MNIEELRFSLQHLPHVKKVWVKDGNLGVYYITPVNDAEEIDLTAEPLSEVKVTKSKKEKLNGN